MSLRTLGNRVRRLLHDPDLPVWYAPQYRLPITSLTHERGVELRRADLAAWSLLESGALTHGQLKTPTRATYGQLSLVHEPELLESLTRPETLARVFAAEPWDVPVDEVLHTVRLAVGGTIAAARAALDRKGPALNLLGGFHHAFPDKAGGLCPVNDIAIAIAVAREEGLRGTIVVLDLDAHPPDGTAACLVDDPDAWIGSISGVDWGALPGRVVERVLPGAGDETYLAVLKDLLGDMPQPQLAFVIAGGDVLAVDHMGELKLSLAGLRARDLAVARALEGVATVWLPGGGYSDDAWRALTGTGLVLALGSDRDGASSADPLSGRFADVSRLLDPRRLGGGDAVEEPWLTEADLADVLGLSGTTPPRLLDYYTAAGVEYGLYRFGLLAQIRRMGYRDLRIELRKVGVGDRLRVFARSIDRPVDQPAESLADGATDGEQVLVELVVDRVALDPSPKDDSAGDAEEGHAHSLLFVHWLTLRHPRGAFSDDKPRLPGQECPGLGLAREAGELLGLMCDRLDLDGVGQRPSWFHVAYVSRYRFAFVDAQRQGRFLALIRDLAELPLLQATRAIAEGRVLLDGEPYTWEPELMVAWRQGQNVPDTQASIAAERDAVHFTVVEQARLEAPVPAQTSTRRLVNPPLVPGDPW